MNRLFAFVARRPGVVLLLTGVLVLLAVPGVVDPRTGELRLWVDPSINRLLSADDPAVEFYETVRKRFGNDEIVLAVLELSDDAALTDVYDPDVLARVARASERLERLPGVARVLSLSTALDVRGVDGDLRIEGFLEPPPETREDALAVRAALKRNPIYEGLLTSPDDRAAAQLVYFEGISDRAPPARGR